MKKWLMVVMIVVAMVVQAQAVEKAKSVGEVKDIETSHTDGTSLVVSKEAQLRIQEEQREDRVMKAKKLLERRDKIEHELKSIKDALKRLDKGENFEVEIPKECGGTLFTTSISIPISGVNALAN